MKKNSPKIAGSARRAQRRGDDIGFVSALLLPKMIERDGSQSVTLGPQHQQHLDIY